MYLAFRYNKIKYVFAYLKKKKMIVYSRHTHERNCKLCSIMSFIKKEGSQCYYAFKF